MCVIDPDAGLRQRVGSMLSALGVDLREFPSAATFLAALPLDPACVVSETRLPDMTGVELIQSLRARGVGAPVILLAAESDVATAVAAMRAGALDFIEKPHVDRLLAWHVRRLIDDGTGEPRALD